MRLFEELLKNVRQQAPLVHCITNYVTVNDVANMVLAVGGSPIMADDEREVEEITSKSDALYINLGTLNARTIKSMVLAGRMANAHNIPLVLDPVGVGISKLRYDTAKELIQQVHFSVVRGNMSEIKVLVKGQGRTKGVDVAASDEINSDNLNQYVDFAKQAAKFLNCVVAISGAIDIVSDGKVAYCLYGGNKMMSRITGTGCQLSGMVATFLGVNSSEVMQSTAAAISMMNICGEHGIKRMTKLDGNASLRNYIIDAAFNLTGEELKKEAKYEIR